MISRILLGTRHVHGTSAGSGPSLGQPFAKMFAKLDVCEVSSYKANRKKKSLRFLSSEDSLGILYDFCCICSSSQPLSSHDTSCLGSSGSAVTRLRWEILRQRGISQLYMSNCFFPQELLVSASNICIFNRIIWSCWVFSPPLSPLEGE